MEECNLHTVVRLPNSVFKPYATVGTNLLFFEKGTPTKEVWFYEHKIPETQKAYSKTRPIKLQYFDPTVAWWGGKMREGRVENESAWLVSFDEIKANGFNLDIKNPNSVGEEDGDPEELMEKYNEISNELENSIESLISLLSRFKG
jgi:type I restriction enzyme M protein